MDSEYYIGMVKWIERHCIREHYGTYRSDNMLFEGFRVILLPNGFDMMPVLTCVKYQIPPNTETEEHFWREQVTDHLLGFEDDVYEDIVFDRFKDWISRAIFRTEDGVIHVRFEMPEPMDGPMFLAWVETLGDRVTLIRGPRGPLYTLPYYGVTTFDEVMRRDD